MRFIKVLKYPEEKQPQKIQEIHFQNLFEVLLEGKTVCGRTFDIKMSGMYEVADKKEYLKHDFSRLDFDFFVIDYLNEVLFPFFKPFVWSLETNFSSPMLFDTGKLTPEGDLEMINFFSDLQQSLTQQSYKTFENRGCKINHISINSTHYNEWLDREENVMSEEKKAHFDEAMNYRKAVDDYMTALYQDIQRKVQLKEFDGSYYIKVMPTPDGVYFRWKRKIGTVPGHTPTLKIYRREGSFYADKFSEDGNGILIIDDIQEKGESIDYLPAKDKDYYYTVNYRAFSAAKGLFGESSWDIYHLFRFNIRLPSQQSAQETDLAKRIREREAHLDKLKVDKHFDLEETKTFINASLRKGETLDDLQASEIERIKAKYAGKPENIEADIKRINAIFNKIRLS